MKVAQLMTHPVQTCRAWESLDVAARLMRDHACGCVVVLDGMEHAIAVITDRDVCLCALRTLRPLDAVRVADAMSKAIHVCRLQDDVKRAEFELAAFQVRRLPVVDEEGFVVGLLSLDDLAREASRERDLFARSVSAEDVGMTLASLTRPHLVVDVEETRRSQA
jgi:CBS domain-containing protein